MKTSRLLLSLAAFGCLSLAAQEAPVPVPDPRQPLALLGAEPGTCETKGCPQLDEHGHPPVSCQYKSGMATGWQCLIICTYEDGNWGTIVASARCN